MGRRKLNNVVEYADLVEDQVQELVRESTVYLRNRLVELSPVGEKNGGTFKSNWQPPVYGDGGFVGRVVNATQNYGLAITVGGKYMPPSWKGTFRSRYGLSEGWPKKLAVKDVENAVPSMWNRIVRKS